MIEVRRIPSAEAVQRRRQPIDPSGQPGAPFLTEWAVSIRVRGDVIACSMHEKWSRRMPDSLSAKPAQSGLYRQLPGGFEPAGGGRERVAEVPIPPCRHNVCGAWLALQVLASKAIGEEVWAGQATCQLEEPYAGKHSEAPTPVDMDPLL